MTASDWRVWVEFPFERCVELVTPRHCSNDLGRAAPGSIVQEHYAHLGFHFAPRRWLLFEPDESRLADLLTGGSRCCDALGKWKLFTAAVSEAQLALAAAIDVEQILSKRGCARAQLFDCPVVLARLEHAFLVCVESSYEAAWLSVMWVPDNH